MSVLVPILLVLVTLLYLGLALLSLFTGAVWFGVLMLSSATLVIFTFVLIGLDAYLGSNIFFFSSIGTNNFVILGNLGGRAIRYFARVKNKDFDPATGKRVRNTDKQGKAVDTPRRQQDFYTSWFLNYLANTWDIYYKGLNTKVLIPEWCDGPRIPHAQVYPWTTDECKVKGLAHNVKGVLTFEIEDMGRYLYLNGKDAVEESVKPDYESALRAFFAKQGEKKDENGKYVYDVRKILGISTEGEGRMDPDFKEQVWNPTVASALEAGRVFVNIAIADIVPASTKIRGIEERQAEAEATKKALVTEAEGKAEADRLVNDVQIAYERELKQLGVDRTALAIEKQTAAGTLVINQGPAQSPIVIPASR